jgi:RNA polymerase primary sigma factor
MARARHIRATHVKYIDHPSFGDPSARDAILAPLADAGETEVGHRFQPLERHARLRTDGSRARLLSREQESHLFRKMNYLKRRAHELKEQLDPEWPSPRDLDEIDRLWSEALAIKIRIIELNLGLVVSIAKTRIRAGYDLAECVSDGNVALIQSVDGFDFARGNRFSTYATWAIRNVIAERERRFIRGRGQSLALYEEFLAAPNAGVDQHEIEDEQNHRRALIGRWLGRLDKRERRILPSRYGIGGVPKLTLSQIGRQLGISKERVRQVEARAHAKVRKLARLEALDASGI